MVLLYFLKTVLGLVVLLLLCCDGSAKKSKRWTYPRPQWPVPGHRMDAEPCRLFVWNVASAARFCECSRHLESVADQTLWEDSHGQLWLRVPFSNPLLRLFPCQQHSLTRCAKCGHDYRAHVEHTLKRRKNGAYDKFIRENAQRIGGTGAQDYRGGSVFSDQKKTSRDRVNANSGGLRSMSGIGNTSGASSANGGISAGGAGVGAGWRKRLAVLAEAQRAALLQTSGIAVTSETARSAFKAVRDEKVKAEAAQEKRDNKRRRVGDGGSAKAGRRTSSSRVREDLDGERYGGGGERLRSGGGGRTEGRGLEGVAPGVAAAAAAAAAAAGGVVVAGRGRPRMRLPCGTSGRLIESNTFDAAPSCALSNQEKLMQALVSLLPGVGSGELAGRQGWRL